MKTKWFYLLSLSFLLAFSACSNDGDEQGSLKDSNANKNVVSASVPTEATGLEFPKIVANGTTRNTVLVRRTADYGEPIPLTTIWIRSRQDGAAIRSASLTI